MQKLLPPDAFPDEMQRVVYQKMVPAAYRGDAMSFALDALPLSSMFWVYFNIWIFQHFLSHNQYGTCWAFFR